MANTSNIIRRALDEKRYTLFEHELFALLQERDCPVPRTTFISLKQLKENDLPGDAVPTQRAVLKVVSPEILHKSNVGGVVFADAPTPAQIIDLAQKMLAQLPPKLARTVRGILLTEAIAFEPVLGRELYLGMRQTREFGLVSTVGFGGAYVEALETATQSDQSTVVFKPEITTWKQLRNRLGEALFFNWTTGNIRGIKATTSNTALVASIKKWLAALHGIRQAIEAEGANVAELELNPLVFAGGDWIPVDALARMTDKADDLSPRNPFPLANLQKGLNPTSTALIGVSKKRNIGRSILASMLEGGYPKDRITIIRNDVKSIAGVTCVPSLSHIRNQVDLLIVAVAASQVPGILAEAFASQNIRAVLLISDGMAKGTQAERKVQALIARHNRPDRPVVIGNNSLGFISKNASFDSLFVPQQKLPRNAGCTNRNAAFVSQSGAFMAMTLNKLPFLCPAYQVSIGNQLDAHMSHYLEVLSRETHLSTLALYIEGLKDGDGLQIARLVKKFVGKSSRSGNPKRDVIIYKAGRSDLGQTAAMGHTSAVAGNWRVFCALMGDAGAMVAKTFDDFLGLVRISSSIGHRTFSGRNVAMMTNAGCEAVGMADNHQVDSHGLLPATFSKRTTASIGKTLKAARMDKLVQVVNPMDLTPMADDAVHSDCMRAMLDDPNVDVAVFGCSPFTSAIQSLSGRTSDKDVFDAPEGYANRTIELFNETSKPFVVVINGGRDYDPMADYLERAGVPVFRSADEAMRIVGMYIEGKISVR